jgi:hypothetical protein
MPSCDQVDGERNQAQRSGERSCGQSVEREYGMRRRVHYGSRGRRIDGMNQHWDDSLKQAQRFVGIRRPRCGLGVGIRGEGRQAGEDNSSESHNPHFSTRREIINSESFVRTPCR